MAQIFHRSTNFISRFSVFAGVFLAGIALTGVLLAARSPYLTNQNVTRDQPIQFSHKHHVGDDGIDCRYCHTAVESSATAGVPPTKTCMNCHSVLFNNVGYLEPVRESYRNDKSIHWVRVIGWRTTFISTTAFTWRRASAARRATARSIRCR